jgi:hypothetical protein
MKIIYHCFGSAHTSVVNASIHLGLLSEDQLPSYRDLTELPHYDETEGHEIGKIFHMGRDNEGNDIYIMGVGSAKPIVLNALQSLMDIYDICSHEVIFVDSLIGVHLLTRIGGFISRRLHLISLGRPLTVLGIRRSFRRYVEVVRSVKERVKEKDKG